MSSWGSYPSIFNFGHKAIIDLLQYDVNVEEKVDGSQFSFGLVEANKDDAGNVVDPIWNVFDSKAWSLKVRSKGAVMHIEAPESLFKEACQTVKDLADGAHMGLEGALHPGWTYRGEVLKKPKHNSLTYDRVPKDHIIIFDINTGDQEYLSYEAKKSECGRIGLEVVPLLFQGKIDTIETFRKFLTTTSILGGQQIEGVVVKPKEYNLFGWDKKVLMGKFVSEAFKEVHRKAWKEGNPGGNDVVGLIAASLRTPARWNKAILHMQERGLIEDSPKDIGPLIKEVMDDVFKEEVEYIKDELFKWGWPHIRRACTTGLPEWYKEKLLAKAFEQADQVKE